MLDRDTWQEVIDTLRQNPWRTLMTASGIFWGVFMLVIMLGFGAGLQRGVSQKMLGFVSNSVYLWGQRTALPFRGFAPGRRVGLNVDDIEALLRGVPGLVHLAPRAQLGGYRDGNDVSYGAKAGNFAVMGDYPALAEIDGISAYRGRFLNRLDLQAERKVAVIGEQVRRVLFQGQPDVLGRYIAIKGIQFKVVGVFDSDRSGQQGDRQNSTVHVPFSTFQRTFNFGGRVGWFAAMARDDVSAEDFEQQLLSVLKRQHLVHPDDRRALGSFNVGAKFARVGKLFLGVRAFTWFVSIATLLAAALGVSNIMLITVKERTREIGVRKALGATPGAIASLVVQETLVLTLVSGYAGLAAGVLMLEGAGRLLVSSDAPMGAPSIDLGVAGLLVLVLLAVGLLAGYAPARFAARIQPVTALAADG